MVPIRRVLVTGMTGFIGRHLQRRLVDEGVEMVSGLEDLSIDNAQRVDIRDRAAVVGALERTKPEVVFHLAGRLKSADPQMLYAANVEGTVALMEAVLMSRLRPRVIVASSSAVYGAGGTALTIEDSTIAPVTHYGASKAAAEMVVQRCIRANGLDAVIVRMFNVVGSGQPPHLAASGFARQVAMRERCAEAPPLRVRRLDAVRDFVDVRDVADALLVVARGGCSGETYNVCSGKGVSMRRCIDILIHGARASLSYEEVKTIESSTDVPMQIGDRAKIGRELGWSPRIPLQQSLMDLLEDWRLRYLEMPNELER
jgi:GDP-4-dehydro-6-deoxy-D-mannose reductase